MTEPKAEKVRRRSREKRNVLVHDDEDDPFPGEAEAGPHIRIRDVFRSHNDNGHNDSGYDHGVPVDVTHYIHDKSVRHRMVLLSLSNSKLGIRLHLLRAVLLILGCVLYVAETIYYDYFTESGGGIFLNDSTILNASVAETIAIQAQTLVLLVEEKPYSIWALQVVNSMAIFLNACVILYVSTSWAWQTLLKTAELSVLIIIIVPVLYFLTLIYPPLLKDLFIPAFFYCWPAGRAVTVAMIQVLQRGMHRRTNSFRLKAISLAVMFLCFLFTWVCIVHHFFRIDQRISFFETYYYLMVTMSTVGYGDISPHHWTGRTLVTVFILSALIYLIPQLQILYDAFTLQQKLNNTVGFKHIGKKHILICAKRLKPLVLRDFLTEFYSDPTHYEVHCVLLVEQELSSVAQMYLRHPIWARRITVLIGTPLKLADLQRAWAQSALACFIHTPRDESDAHRADQHTIMCSWAVRDFSPKVKLYVHILRPANRLHLEVADHIVCEGELRNALLASTCHCPGVGTLVTLLLHTFKPERRQLASEEYQLYTQCAPCEIYDCRLGDSKYFHHFDGKNFLYTAVVAFRKYHVTLLGVRPYHLDHILLNPGLDYVMDNNDICYYIGFTREEYSQVGGATSIQHALQQSCAKVAIYSLAVCGINPHDLHEQKVHAEKKPPKQPVGLDLPDDSSPTNRSNVSFYISRPSSSEVSLDNVQLHTPTEVSQTHLQALEARRGLHLLKFHSSLDMHANPVVKVSLLSCNLSEGAVSSDEYIHQTDGLGSKHVSFTEQATSHPEHKQDHQLRLFRGEPLPVIREKRISESESASTEPEHRPSIQRSLSEGSHLDHRSPTSKDPVLYSSSLSLVETQSTSKLNSSALNDSNSLSPHTAHHHRTYLRRPSVWSVLTRTSRGSMSSLDGAGDDEDVVELELADIEEEEELEGLEDGYCEERGSTNDRSPTPTNVLDDRDVPRERPHRVRYEKGPLPTSPYFGFETPVCHLLLQQRTHDEISLVGEGISSTFGPNWKEGVVIVYSDSVTESIYHFTLPLRAHYIPTSALRPLIIMIKNSPPKEFIETMSWLPLVYYIIGDIADINDWLQAGITVADSVVIFNDPVLPRKPDDEQHEHMADAAHIMAVQKLSKLFPQVNIISELNYRYNIRFMRYTACDDHFIGNLNALMRKGDHLTYLFLPQFAGGRVFCPSMLDTLLYQAHCKPYIVDLVRQLLGCKQVPGSGFLWHIPLTEELLQLQTYERVFQRLVSTHRYIPLGIHRSVPSDTCKELLCEASRTENKDCFVDGERIKHFLESQMKLLGLEGLRSPRSQEKGYQSFVLPNPPPKTQLKPRDIILVLRCDPSAHSPHHNEHSIPADMHNAPSTLSHGHTEESQMYPDDLQGHTPHAELHRRNASPIVMASGLEALGAHYKMDSHHHTESVIVPIECYNTETQV